MKEAEELNTPTELYFAQPLEDNLFEWHFTIRGPSETDFDEGIYHGRILLPTEYPMKPPSIIMLTHSGRFKVHEKICLSISGHHPETWLPSWSIRTALLALIGFMPTLGEGAIGSLDYTSEERKSLARKSLTFTCSACKTNNADILQSLTDKSNKISAEAKDLASKIAFTDSVSKDFSLSGTNSSDESIVQRRSHKTVNSTEDNQEEGEKEVTSTPYVSNDSNGINNTGPRSNTLALLYLLLGTLFVILLIRRIYLLTE